MYYFDHFNFDEGLNFNLIYSEKGLVYLGIDEYRPPDFVPYKNELIQLAYPRLRLDLLSYFQGEKTEFDYDLDLRTTSFRKRVYGEICKIPYGRVCTYKDIACLIDNPKGQRAVGQAVGSNPLPIIVPCHRVIAKNSLGGFSLGLDLKRKLLKIEGSSSDYYDNRII